MVSLASWSPKQRPVRTNLPTDQLIRDLFDRGLWPIIGLLLAALAIIVLWVFPGTEPTGAEFLMGP
jgi:hypothetical protein